jgi:four helix bundle protein
LFFEGFTLKGAVMGIQNYRDLITWQKAMDLTEVIYRITATFPTDERFGLTQQMRRAAVSVPSNIAEGHSRRSTPEYLRFLNIAYGSRAELETQILIASRLKYLDEAKRSELMESAEEVGRLINGPANSLNN